MMRPKRFVPRCGMTLLALAGLLAAPVPAQRGGGGGEGGSAPRGPAQPRSAYNFALERDRSGAISGGRVIRGTPDPNAPARPPRPEPRDRGAGDRPDEVDRDERPGRPDKRAPEQVGGTTPEVRDLRTSRAWRAQQWDRDKDGRPDWWREREHWRNRPFRDWRDVDTRYLHDDDFRRGLYFESLYRYYPLPLWQTAWFGEGGTAGADYSRTTERITSTDTAEADARGAWVEERTVEVPIEEEVAGETVRVYHPAVYRQRADGTLERLEAESWSEEPKVRVILRQERIAGHYENDER